LVVRSHRFAEAQKQQLETRLVKAQAEIAALTEYRQGKKRFTDESLLREAIDRIVTKYRVTGLLILTITPQVVEQTVRPYKDRPQEVRTTTTLSLTVTLDQTAVEDANRRLGWRVYATNQSPSALTLEQAVLAYRAQYFVERAFGRLKGKSLSLTPIFFHSDARVTGLIRLLTIALRALTLLEYTARQTLHLTQSTLAGLYPGNPKRATRRPTSELLLRAFVGITLTVLVTPTHTQVYLPALSPLQHHILHLLEMSPHLFARIQPALSRPLPNFTGL
jgi:transposase